MTFIINKIWLKTWSKLWSLPPVKARSFNKHLANIMPKTFTEKSNDTFIYYLFLKRSIILSLILMIGFWCRFHIYFDSLRHYRKSFVNNALATFPVFAMAVLLLTLLPLHVCIIIHNVPKHFDFLWWSQIPIRRQGRVKTVLTLTAAIGIFLVAGFGCGCLPAELRLNGSITGSFLCIAWLIFIPAVSTFGILIVLLRLWSCAFTWERNF